MYSANAASISHDTIRLARIQSCWYIYNTNQMIEFLPSFNCLTSPRPLTRQEKCVLHSCVFLVYVSEEVLVVAKVSLSLVVLFFTHEYTRNWSRWLRKSWGKSSHVKKSLGRNHGYTKGVTWVVHRVRKRMHLKRTSWPTIMKNWSLRYYGVTQ